MSDLITVNMNKKPIYDICIESDFSGLAAKIKELGFEGKKFMVITDSTVGPLYADTIKEELKDVCSAFFLYSFPAGESSKNLDTVTKILSEMVANKINRHDLVIALGGGVVGDTAGFCAAIYQRGIAVVQVPTTLLSQCDSSIGGKTAVDFNGYKNMIGAFYMPSLVYMNICVLSSLSGEQFASGFAEFIPFDFYGIDAETTIE